MRIFSFDLILAMDFLNKIAEFMTTGLADDEPKKKEEVPSVKISDKSYDHIGVSIGLFINLHSVLIKMNVC